MGPFTQSSTTGIIGFETNEFGHITRGRTNSIPAAGLDTTANTYAIGCEIIDSSTAIVWTNTGTVAAPVWSSFAPVANQFASITVNPTSIPLLFGGTNVQLLPVPPAGTAYEVNDFVIEDIGAGSVGYGAGGTTLRLLYGLGGTASGAGGTNIIAYMNLGTATFFGTSTKILQGIVAPATTGQTIVPGNALWLDNTTAAFTAAGAVSSMKISLWYSVINV